MERHTVLISQADNDLVNKYKEKYGYSSKAASVHIILEFVRENEHALNGFFQRKAGNHGN